ncbi:MAG: hypothetical protein ABSF79_03660 [Smithellaceae bacterium]|jgi:DNA-binding PadR family transcriptional regulator
MEERINDQDIKKIREMMEFLVKQNISESIKELSSQERKIYDLTGIKGQREISKEVKTSASTIINLWKKLESEGILIKEGKGYRKVI